MLLIVFVLMSRLPPRPKLTVTLCPSTPLVRSIRARAEGYRRRGRERLADLVRHLGPRWRLALDGLVRVYEGLHADFRERYAARLEQLPGLEAGHRVAAFQER